MKIFRNIILSSVLTLAAFSFASCDLFRMGEEVKHGDGDAVVGFASPEYSFKESAGIVRVPVQVTGSPLDYPLTFDVKAEALNLVDLASLDDLVLFTQKTDFKDYGNGTIYVEFKISDDTEINEDRTFKIGIVNLEGGKLAEVTETVVTVKDNDNNPYEKLWGDWVFHATSSAGAAVDFAVSISGGFDEETIEANADKILVCWGAAGYQWSDHTPVWYLSYDADAQQVAIIAGKQLTVPGDVDWGAGGNQYAMMLYWDPAQGSSDSVDLPGSWDKDLTTITFTPGLGVELGVYNESGYLGYWYRYHTITMTRK
jgi:hypothetical protein